MEASGQQDSMLAALQPASVRSVSPRAMLRQLVLAALLASADALARGASASRRAVLGQAAASGAGALLLAPLAARAQELKQACHPHSALALASPSH